MKFQGSVTKITYYNQENGYGVVRVAVSIDEMNRIIEEVEDDSNFYSNTISVVSIFTTLPLIDQIYEFDGEFEYSKYGLQFRSEKTTKTVKQSEQGIIAYLSSSLFKGIGAKTAEKVYMALGEDALKKIIEDKSVLDKVDITEKQKDEIYKSLNAYYHDEESLVELLSLGLSLKLAKKIILAYQDRALSVTKENPYDLIGKVEGIGFLRADDIAMKVGIDKKSAYRMKALIRYSLEESIYSSGDTYKLINDLYVEISRIVNEKEEILSKDEYLDYLEELNKDKKIIIDGDKILDIKIAYAEEEIAKIVATHLKKEVRQVCSDTRMEYEIKELEKSYHITYNPKQKEAIKNALNENISIITGGPGTGKSTIIKAIIEIYKNLADEDKLDLINSRIKLVAPTGRAAKRLRELCYHSASTIHKLLGYTGHIFTVNTVDADIIIIDEFSMVDIALAYHLFKAIGDDTKIIIVGDSDQLPAVGAGDILNDLILSKEVSVVRLDEIHRQSKDSTIISLAHDINHGYIPSDVTALKSDRRFITCEDNNIISLTQKTIDVYLNQLHMQNDDIDEEDYLLKEKEALVNDIQVLVPMYKGTLGIDAFNHFLQEHFNPLSKDNPKQIVYGNKKYRIFDKVIQLVNRSEKNVMNGDIGYVHSFIEESGEIEGLIVRYNFGDVEYNMDELDDISLAYAISIHKAQGSEFKLVIVPFSFKYYVMLKKKLIYTAVTRAKKYLIMVGKLDALRKGILSIEEKRHTRLESLLKNIIDNPNKVSDNASAFEEILLENEEIDSLSPYDFMEE